MLAGACLKTLLHDLVHRALVAGIKGLLTGGGSAEMGAEELRRQVATVRVDGSDVIEHQSADAAMEAPITQVPPTIARAERGNAAGATLRIGFDDSSRPRSRESEEKLRNSVSHAAEAQQMSGLIQPVSEPAAQADGVGSAINQYPAYSDTAGLIQSNTKSDTAGWVMSIGEGVNAAIAVGGGQASSGFGGPTAAGRANQKAEELQMKNLAKQAAAAQQNRRR